MYQFPIDQFSVVCVFLLLPRNCRTYSFHYYPFLRLLILSSLQEYHHFFMGMCLWRLSWSLQMVPHCHPGPDKIQSAFLRGWASCCYSPPAHSLGLLVLSGSIVRCHLVQMYYHLISRVILNPVWALPWGLEFGWLLFSVGSAIHPQFVTPL
jgi:hypothetical protein